MMVDKTQFEYSVIMAHIPKLTHCYSRSSYEFEALKYILCVCIHFSGLKVHERSRRKVSVIVLTTQLKNNSPKITDSRVNYCSTDLRHSSETARVRQKKCRQIAWVSTHPSKSDHIMNNWISKTSFRFIKYPKVYLIKFCNADKWYYVWWPDQ